MAILIQVIKYFVGAVVNMQTFLGVLIQTVSAVLGAGIFYFSFSLIFKFEEVSVLSDFFKKKKKK